jgi:hypothetical protein
MMDTKSSIKQFFEFLGCVYCFFTGVDEYHDLMAFLDQLRNLLISAVTLVRERTVTHLVENHLIHVSYRLLTSGLSGDSDEVLLEGYRSKRGVKEE